jgi:UDP-N-acetylmuramoyl-tripeptide--D-alanyl-D-alanine ligase
VDETTRALGRLGAWHRQRFAIPVAAVTGSNGKTTTKEMVAAVLSSRFETFKTPGNLNSEIGLPLALLQLTARHQVAVCELGMSSRGEIDRLGALTRPRGAVFTNIAPAHLEKLRTLEAVAAAKFELLEHVSADGFALFCADDPLLRQRARQFGSRSRTFGLESDADLRGFDVRVQRDGVRFRLEGGFDVALPLFGRHNVYNALAALLVAELFGVDRLAAVAALAVMEPASHRSRILEQGTLTVIDDVYNANPEAVKSALQSLVLFPASARRVAVLGDMLELGNAAEVWHDQVGAEAARLGLDALVCVGDWASELGRAAVAAGMAADSVYRYTTAQACADDVRSWCRPDDTILLKGSRGATLEQVLAALLPVNVSELKEES